jgi:hypothetical protein
MRWCGVIAWTRWLSWAAAVGRMVRSGLGVDHESDQAPLVRTADPTGAGCCRVRCADRPRDGRSYRSRPRIATMRASLPLAGANCGANLRIIAYITDAVPVEHILLALGERHRVPPIRIRLDQPQPRYRFVFCTLASTPTFVGCAWCLCSRAAADSNRDDLRPVPQGAGQRTASGALTSEVRCCPGQLRWSGVTIARQGQKARPDPRGCTR